MTLPLLWRLLTILWVALELYILLATRVRRSSDSGADHDRGSLRLLWIAITLSIAAEEWTRAALGPNLPQTFHWLRTAGVVLLAAALGMRLIAFLSLGRAFTANVAIQHEQTVYRGGLYRYMRHPSYTGLLLILLAWGLHSLNWISLLAATVLPLLALLYRIHVEEQALLSAFGEDYRSYMRSACRLFPGLY